jgi:hypothetical protein
MTPYTTGWGYISQVDTPLKEIDNYDKFKEKNQRLPLRQEISDLNQIRNLVQHQAVEPETSTMEDWRVFSKTFLVKVFDEYFSYNFDDISSVTLIDNDRLQQLLQCSWIRLTKGQWFESILLSKISFIWASSKIYDFLPSKGQNSKFLATSRISSNVRHLTSDGGQQIVKTVETLFDRIRETEHFTAILSSGIKLLDFKQFEESSPAIDFAGGGKPYSYRRKEYTDDQAKWVHSFVVDAIVNWQFLGLNPTVPEWAIKGFEGIISEETQKDV